MSAPIAVPVPRINANEDEVVVTQILVASGQRVQEGELLFVVESTKGAVEVVAPSEGTIAEIAVVEGAPVSVGLMMCMLTVDGASIATAPLDPQPLAEPERTEGDPRITAGARILAEELGIDLAEVVPVNGRVRREEVEAFARGRATPTSTPQPPMRAVVVTASVGTGGIPAVVVGGGPHATIVLDMLAGSGYRIVGCTDVNEPPGKTVLDGVPILGPDELLPELLAQGVRIAFIGVGGATSNALRRRIFAQLQKLGFMLPCFVHPSAYLGRNSFVGEASYVMPGALVGPNCTIGRNVIVNCRAQISHDCVIGDHVHLTPGAILAGTVSVGDETTVGMAATVLFGTNIGTNCLIHNGAAVIGNIADNIEFTRNGAHRRRAPR
jgi:sugar O-acyltransferase (sialic acid O-acetyltransferase NeuD family)